MLFENRKHLVAEPTEIAKLYRPAVIFGAAFKKAASRSGSAFQLGGQLHRILELNAHRYSIQSLWAEDVSLSHKTEKDIRVSDYPSP